MMRSLFAGVAGLTSHQTRMDVIGNNIANVNTTGFKASRVTFQDTLYQTLNSASPPTERRGGTNPVQVGMGVQVGSIDVIHTAGSPEPTGIQTDLAISGNGFFVLQDGERQLYTRAGAFDFDEEGWLGSPATGLRVAGWNAVDGEVNTNLPLEEIQVPFGQTLPARATTGAAFEGNLDAELEDGATVTTTVRIVDSLGVHHRVFLEFTKEDNNEWSWTAFDEAGNQLDLLDDNDASVSEATLHFDDQGRLITATSEQFRIQLAPGNGAETVVFRPNLAAVSQYGQPAVVDARSQNGFSSGTLEEVRIDGTGGITGVFSNGLTQVLGQIAVATFANNGGLVQVGESTFEASTNSGLALTGAPGTADRGLITPGTLEMSNVDLSQEFTSMIITQRGFQANSRIITTSDEMLQELVNLKR